ncbi:VOC family protein [Ekhidna sp.]|uniref:VOC family protein n=1 Tax=Ekhidna sp. TaxID=2608089 RepID=UPI003B50E7E2
MTELPGIEFKFHHTGLMVKSISDCIHHYSKVFGVESISRVYEIDSQKVNVVFIKNGAECYLELVEPWGEESSSYNLLKKHISYYHIAYQVSDINESVAYLESLNYKALELFTSEAFDGRSCIFLFSPEAHLIELIES